ncbi:MAG: TadE/TadG family type IV pilus assembly protein [Nocardioides sp.]
MSEGWPRGDERGVMAIEVVILTPLLVAAIMVIAAGARYVDARGQVNDAAYAAARAASLTTNQESARQAGIQAARDSMTDRGEACSTLTVHIDAGDFEPGGDVTARVTCATDLRDITGFGIPGHKTFTFTAVAPLDSHRSFP